MLEVLMIVYASGLPLAAVWFAWLFHNLPSDEWGVGDIGTLHGVLAAVVFVVFWPVVFAWMIWFYWFERQEAQREQDS